jgi:NADH-quinone oxidoreductase subunit C
MTAVNNNYVLEALQSEFANDILLVEEPYNMLTITLKPEMIVSVLKFLHSHSIIQANFLTDICGSHYPEAKGQELNIVYHLHSFVNNFRLRIKCFVSIDNPNIPSATSVYNSANWMERETFDFYGLNFVGHPNLKRILNVDEMDYFPLRKEFPLEDATRTDKDDKYFGR